MAIGSLISIDEYLTTSYRPDWEYVDGVVVERNVGERDHSRVETDLSTYFNVRREQWNICVYVEQRVQVSQTRYRVPDVCVILGPEPDEQILTTPPFICVEILSKDDRMAEMQERVADYLSFGVPYVWIIDPRKRKAWRCTRDGMQEVGGLHTTEPEIEVPLSELFR